MNERVQALMNVAWLIACLFLMQVSISQAAEICPYDASGQYGYDPQRNPAYLFYGDGQITYDGSRPWYMDDTLACYRTYRNPAYFIYFPMCDLDGSGVVELDEVFDIYYRVQPVNQPDLALQKICVEGLGAKPNVFCPENRYNRVALDVDAIKTQYPLTEAVFDGSVAGRGQESIGADALGIRCASASGDLPMASFESLGDCYGQTATCIDQHATLAEHCAGIEFGFDGIGVDVPKILGDYTGIALQHGGSCALTEAPAADPHGTPGFHYTEIDSNLWHWTVRATAQCIGETCDCDITYQFETRADQPGNLVLLNEEDRSTAQCSYPEMGTTWPYPFHWDYIAARAVLNLRGVNGTIGADRDDYLRAVRDLDLIGEAHPYLDHHFGWWSDVKKDMRYFNELRCTIDDTATRADLDELVGLLRAWEMTYTSTQRRFVFPDDINAEVVISLFEETNPISSCYQSIAFGNGMSAPAYWAEILADDGNGRWHWRIETRWGGCDWNDCNCEYAYEFYTYADQDLVEDAQAINPDRSASLLDEAQCGMPCGSCGVAVDRVPLLVVLADFADAPISLPADAEAGWADLMFGTHQGEANHYWNEVFEGQFQVEPVYETFGEAGNGVIRVQLSDNQPTDNTGHDVTTEWMPEILDLAANHVDFAAYDGDGDGELTNQELSVLVVFNLNSLQASGGAVANININYEPNGVGPTIKKYARTLWFYSSIGVNVHELGHHIFDIRDMNEPDDHLLMGGGAYGEDPVVGKLTSPGDHWGTRPTHPGGYTKVAAGFVAPTLITDTTLGVTLHAPDSGNYNVLAVPSRDGVNFVEYRTSQGYDQSIPFCEDHTAGFFVTEVSEQFRALNLPGIAIRRDAVEYEYPLYPSDICEFYGTPGTYDDFSIGGFRFTNFAFVGSFMTLDIIKEEITPQVQSYKLRYFVEDATGARNHHWVEAHHGGTVQIDFSQVANGDDASSAFGFGLDSFLNTGEARPVTRWATWSTSSDYLDVKLVKDDGGGTGCYVKGGAAVFRFDPEVAPTSAAIVSVEYQGFRTTLELVNLPIYP